ncbi:MAG: patatin-like phospholipase family protein [Acidimicrobiia bacterium]
MSRALVLSGGGPVGIAWETGIAVGLAMCDVDLSEADFIVGTSAGSAVGAQLALGRDLNDAVSRYRRAAERQATEKPRGPRPTHGATSSQMGELRRKLAETLSSQASQQERLAAIGKFALESNTPSEEDFVETYRYSRGEPWPKSFVCSAVDALTGEFVVWSAESGVELDRAVASSCSVPGVFPPITMNGRRYIDGGMRSVTNADLAKGHDRVLIVSTLLTLQRSDEPRVQRYRRTFENEVAEIVKAGGQVATLGPNPDSTTASLGQLMDPSRAFEALEEGIRQVRRGDGEADRIREFWQ